MRRAIGLLLALLAFGPPAWAAVEVRVGCYEFSPYVEIDADGRVRGLTPELLDLLNESQGDYRFVPFLTTPSRRYQDFEAGLYDVIFFESPDWGWRSRNLPIDVSPVFLEDAEVYIAHTEPGRTQAYFDDFAGKTIAGLLGYHYAFADFDSDPERLRSRFAMHLVTSNQASIELVLRHRVDLAVVTLSYLKGYLADHPDARSDLLVSDRRDQIYRHRIIVRKGFKPDAEALFALLEGLQRNGALEALWRRHHL